MRINASNPADVDGFPLRLAAAGFETRQLEQVGDDAVHAFGLPLHLAHGLAPALVQDRIFGERIEVAAHDGQRRAQFVRGIGHEIPAHAFEPRFAGDVADDQQLQVAPAGRDEVEGEPAIAEVRHVDARPRTPAAAGNVFHELRLPDQVVDADAVVELAAQIRASPPPSD